MPKPRKSEYAAKFQDPRWQQKRLRIFERDEFMCHKCYDVGDPPKPLHVHHRFYKKYGTDPWDYPDEALVTLCEPCHEEETALHGEARQRLLEVVMADLFSEDVIRLADALEMGLLRPPLNESGYRVWMPFEVVECLHWLFKDKERARALLFEAYEAEARERYAQYKASQG
jgi:hypothetical protein